MKGERGSGINRLYALCDVSPRVFRALSTFRFTFIFRGSLGRERKKLSSRFRPALPLERGFEGAALYLGI